MVLPNCYLSAFDKYQCETYLKMALIRKPPVQTRQKPVSKRDPQNKSENGTFRPLTGLRAGSRFRQVFDRYLSGTYPVTPCQTGLGPTCRRVKRKGSCIMIIYTLNIHISQDTKIVTKYDTFVDLPVICTF